MKAAEEFGTGSRDVRDHVDEVALIRGVENHAVDGAVQIGNRRLVVFLDDINDAFDAIRRGEAIRSVIVYP